MVPSERSTLFNRINFTLRATGEEPCSRIIRPGEPKYQTYRIPIVGRYYRCKRCDLLNEELKKTKGRAYKATCNYEIPQIASSYSTGGPSYAGEESDDSATSN